MYVASDIALNLATMISILDTYFLYGQVITFFYHERATYT